MTGKQKKAIAALLNASTVREAAAAAGISYATLRRWLAKDAEFRAAYNSELQGVLDHAAAQARIGMDEAAGVMRGIINDRNAPRKERISAGRALMEFGPKLVEIQDFEARITELEKRI